MKIIPILPPDLREDADRKFEALRSAATDANITLPGDPEFIATIKQVFVFSEFVSKGCIRNPGMLADLVESGNLGRRFRPGEYHTMLESFLSGVGDEARLLVLLRRFRRREMTRIAFRDLAGWSDLAETMADLSAFADACLDRTISLLYEWQCAESGIPSGSDGSRQRPVVLGMGKLGGFELNFSSDVDLIFAYPEAGETVDAEKPVSNDDFFVRLCRRLIKAVGTNTSDGTVFRIDTDLRPYGESGPLVMSFDAMEEYYQEQGREWERYAWIKARVVAGDKPAGARLLERLKPFIYRRYLDFGAFESLRRMKQKISREVKRKGMSGNIKLGPGGIREIEFFGQTFQLIRGGVSFALQESRIQKVLAILAVKNCIPRNVCDELTDAYEFLRNLEHRLQEFSDRQTHELPTDPKAKLRLAASMGFAEPESFVRCLEAHKENVHRHFNTLLESRDSTPPDEKKELEMRLEAVWLGQADGESGRDALMKVGFDEGNEVTRLLDHLRKDPATRSLSREGRSRLDRLIPKLLKAVGQSEQPLPVLTRIIDLIKAIQQRTNYLSLLLEEPAAISHLVKLANASPWIASYLARHPVLLDELLDPRSLYLPPEKADLKNEVRRRLDGIDPRNLEHQIEELCVFKQVNTLRVAAADVSGALPLMRTSDHLTYIAETILDEVLEVSWAHLVEKNGTPDCRLDTKRLDRGFTVVAYGKLGGIELGYGSDLDLVFLHAGVQGQTRGGRLPTDNAQFFARLGQRVVHILSAHTSAGVLYEPDMRLRPSGGSGPLVSHIEGFEEYQMNTAWTWEHQALVRARPVSGEIQVMKRFEEIRKAVLARPRIKAKLREEITGMRERMRRELLNPEPGLFDLKQDAGGIVDIEFLVQHLVLLNSCKFSDLLTWTDNVRILETLIETGVLDKNAAAVLKEAYLTFRASVHRLNLQGKPSKVPENRFPGLRKSIEEIWADIMCKN
ncbi:MAG: bifunctional [glutamate--ammonia ligase]-adenylyl-L-tyrosine phosphorylase/[glutamate--ammonia-ligase] adenylyltransferase [Pseudomonadota bacterium]